MASRSIAPPSLLTTSRRLIEQLEIFEKDIVQCKDHQAVQDFPNHFAVVKQAMLAVKNSQDGVTSGLERFEPNSVLSHQLPEEFLVEEPPPTCYRIVPTQSIEIVGVPYVHSDDMQISPRDPNGWPTLRAARNHLLWKRFPTPLTSVFSDKSRALDWARMLETRHEEVQFVLVEINTSSLPHALLYDATKLAKYLDLPTFRIDYHHGESFLLGPIDRRYIAQKSPITRGRRLEQRIDSTMLDSFDLMNQEAIKYASDTPGKQSRRNEPGQKAGKSQAPQQAGSEYGREDSTVGERTIVEPEAAQAPTQRRLSASQSLPLSSAAPKRAKIQDDAAERERQAIDRLAREEEDFYRQHRDYYNTTIVGAPDATINRFLNKLTDAPVDGFPRRWYEKAHRMMWNLE